MILRALHGLSQLIKWLETAVLAVLTLTMFLVVFSQVLFRYVFNSPSPWTEEAARYLFIWISLVGAAFGVGQGSHFGFDLLVQKLPAGVQRASGAWVVPACMSILVFVLVYHGFRMLRIVSFQVTPALQMPMRYVYLSLPVAGILMAFHLLCNLFRVRDHGRGAPLA
jgi:TRAP-type transport system small permease protein